MEGDVICGKLMIGEKAVITGQIEADEVTIRGRITGRVKAGKVHLAKTARVSGDIFHDTLAIEAGAFLDGHCKRNDATPASMTAPPATAATAPAAAAAVPAATPKVAAAPSRNPDVSAARQGAVQDGAGNTLAKTAAGN